MKRSIIKFGLYFAFLLPIIIIAQERSYQSANTTIQQQLADQNWKVETLEKQIEELKTTSQNHYKELEKRLEIKKENLEYKQAMVNILFIVAGILLIITGVVIPAIFYITGKNWRDTTDKEIQVEKDRIKKLEQDVQLKIAEVNKTKIIAEGCMKRIKESEQVNLDIIARLQAVETKPDKTVEQPQPNDNKLITVSPAPLEENESVALPMQKPEGVTVDEDKKSVSIPNDNYAPENNVIIPEDIIKDKVEAEPNHKSTEKETKEDEIWNDKGDALLDSGKAEEALECYQKAIRLNPDNDNNWYNKGNAQQQLNRYDEALASYNSALEINPENDKAWSNKGNVLKALGKVEIALGCFDSAIKFNPNNGKAWEDKIKTLQNLKKHDEAWECYGKALEMNPNLDIDPNNEKNTAKNTKKVDSISKNQNIAIEENRIQEKVEKEFISAAAPEAKSISMKVENEPEVILYNDSEWNNKGCELFILGKAEEALQHFNKAIEINPEHDGAWNNKGDSFKALGKTEEALECYKKAIEINPQNEKALKNKEKLIRSNQTNWLFTDMY